MVAVNFLVHSNGWIWLQNSVDLDYCGKMAKRTIKCNSANRQCDAMLSSQKMLPPFMGNKKSTVLVA